MEEGRENNGGREIEQWRKGDRTMEEGRDKEEGKGYRE